MGLRDERIALIGFKVADAVALRGGIGRVRAGQPGAHQFG